MSTFGQQKNLANLRTITFSHRYKKMPSGVEFLDTWIKDISLVEFKDLSAEYLKLDTETVDGEFYDLPRGKLIWIKLYSDALPKPVEWATLRRYTPEKFEYYSKLVGQNVNIKIDPEY